MVKKCKSYFCENLEKVYIWILQAEMTCHDRQKLRAFSLFSSSCEDRSEVGLLYMSYSLNWNVFPFSQMTTTSKTATPDICLWFCVVQENLLIKEHKGLEKLWNSKVACHFLTPFHRFSGPRDWRICPPFYEFSTWSFSQEHFLVFSIWSRWMKSKPRKGWIFCRTLSSTTKHRQSKCRSYQVVNISFYA